MVYFQSFYLHCLQDFIVSNVSLSVFIFISNHISLDLGIASLLSNLLMHNCFQSVTINPHLNISLFRVLINANASEVIQWFTTW